MPGWVGVSLVHTVAKPKCKVEWNLKSNSLVLPGFNKKRPVSPMNAKLDNYDHKILMLCRCKMRGFLDAEIGRQIHLSQPAVSGTN